MAEEIFGQNGYDIDPPETAEWRQALASVIRVEGEERARFLLSQLALEAEQAGVTPPVATATAYLNTIPAEKEENLPQKDLDNARKLLSYLRWNSMAMVVRAGKRAPELGGHIATYASSAVLYEVGFQYFFKAATKNRGADLIFYQGHASPGMYARSFLEGRFSEDELDRFRQEANAKGLSSYPHPWLMPEYWSLPTVSMGLGPLQAIYQARFIKYLDNRGLGEHSERKIWAFLGDGEMDEPESAGALSIAARERLDNLIFVVNCNLLRLDGPVRASGKVIQEFDSLYRGAGWNVIKVLWNSKWDELFAKDHNGTLLKHLTDCVDGDFQRFNVNGPEYLRENFFGRDPELAAMIADWTDKDLLELEYGGHDFNKMYNAYKKAVSLNNGRPTVILAKTVKGYGMGSAGEGMNPAHQSKKMSSDDLKVFCKRFGLPLSDKQIEKVDYYIPEKNSPEIKFMHKQRKTLGGYLPARHPGKQKLNIPELAAFNKLLEGTGDHEISTTMAFVRIIGVLLKQKELKKHIVPIVADEARTFGMEGLFRQIGVYSAVGQRYESYDQSQIMAYREAKDGQLLEEGLSESGSMASWLAAATSYANNDLPMLPIYIYYSMFGFQRTGDLCWLAGDIRARGFLLGATAGRTTLAGEGLQHQDGHNHLMFSFVPSCRAYDPAFAYELAVIMHDGMQKMYVDQQDIYYYISVMNENYTHPAMPKGVEEGIKKGMYRFKKSSSKAKVEAQLLGSGTILNEVIKASEILENEYSVATSVWSVTSFSELRRDGMDVERYNSLHLDPKQHKTTYVSDCLKGTKGPVVATSDYIRLHADQIRQYVPGDYHVLGTDGYGRSDTRSELRKYFEVNAGWVVYLTLKVLADRGEVPKESVKSAMKKFGIDPKRLDPWTT